MAIGSMREETVSLIFASAMRVRSTTAAACRGCKEARAVHSSARLAKPLTAVSLSRSSLFVEGLRAANLQRRLAGRVVSLTQVFGEGQPGSQAEADLLVVPGCQTEVLEQRSN